MTWSEIRVRYPWRWVVFEIVRAHMDGPRRVLDDLRVCSAYQDPFSAINDYVQYQAPPREIHYAFTGAASDAPLREPSCLIPIPGL